MENRNIPPPNPPTRPITLSQPRPTSERHRNLYLGAPIVPQHGSSGQPHQHQGFSGGINNLNNPGGGSSSSVQHNHNLQLQTGQRHQQQQVHVNNHNIDEQNSLSKNYRVFDSSLTAAEQVRLPINSRKGTGVNSSGKSKFSGKHPSDRSSQGGDDDTVVTAQPTKQRSLLGDDSGFLMNDDGEKQGSKATESSIMCPYCRKCRCEACATPKPLPSRWICSKSIHCGPEPLLDYVTCLCCVKALFYHCGKNHENDGGVLCADKPCSCGPHRKFWRWGCMTAMSLVLPCLCLYWPCKACIHVAEKTYQRHHNNGCNCRSPSPSNHQQNRSNSPLQPHLLFHDEDRHLHSGTPHVNRPPDVTLKIGATKLLPSD